MKFAIESPHVIGSCAACGHPVDGREGYADVRVSQTDRDMLGRIVDEHDNVTTIACRYCADDDRVYPFEQGHVDGSVTETRIERVLTIYLSEEGT